VAYAKGDRDDRDGVHYRLAWRPTAVIFSEQSGENRVDQDLKWSAGWRGRSSGVAYSGAFRKLGDATADTGRATDRKEIENAVRLAWFPREKLALELAVGHALSDYDDAVLLDSRTVFAEAVVRYAYSPK